MSAAYRRVVDALERHDCRPRGTAARCPAHEDRAPSLSIREAEQFPGALVRCHAGCPTEDVLAALGLSSADLFDEPRQASAGYAVVAEYPYIDERGEVLFVKERREPRDFRIKTPDGRPGKNGARSVLYRLPEVLAAVADGRPVYVVEGEKDADALARLGHVATCNFEGAAKPGQRPKWRPEYGDVLRGADVTVVADRDEAGWAHADAVRADLTGKARSVMVRQAAEGKDVSDHLAAGRGVDDLEPVQSDAPKAAPEGIAERYRVLDWLELWDSARVGPDWLCEPLLEAGRVVALYSPAKTGKSLLSLEIAAALAAGRRVLGNAARPPLRVLYVDLENSRDDIRERLEHLGYGPRDLSELRYLSFPSLPALDSPQGGADLLAVAQHHAARLVVLDTVSRVIEGDEDASDTFRALYRHAVMPLKAAGVAVLRLDHSGKDVTRGQRGSSGKADDVDAVWLLTRRNDDTLDLRRTHSRTNHGVDHVELVRRLEPLRHDVPLLSAARSEADEVARRLDVLGVPREAGRPAARDALRASGYKVSTTALEQAVRQRKTLPGLPGAVPQAQSGEQDDTAALGAAPSVIGARSDGCPGQPAGSQGSPSPGSCPDLPARPSLLGTGSGVGGPTDITSDPSERSPSVLGRCLQCGAVCVRYGPDGATLCPACQTLLAVAS